ncbi:carbon monoxide dehydrogenase subunit G [Rhodobacter sp. KR11]|uniref:CoxG family protein n=1 Tax=Rhodobacter sp. KR11 TaxID=2974588 RepID=UPI002223EC0D|nr:carbon monoxide dehydrogenase subunit G [Rhodobacter sp. KR11]MCW1920647.1 carbon monoxide dehydrogenase subunit G [Rhodobacter sp. KR11]
MELSDSRHIAARPDIVWPAILDPEVLAACIPGCESLTGSVEAGYEAVVVQKVGPVSARFTGVVTLSDIIPGQSLTITGEGKGGAAGFAKGGAKVSLSPDGEGTLLTYEVKANVGGKLAQLGSRIIDGFTKKLADQFFENFAAKVGGPPPETDSEPEPETEEAPKKGWFGRLWGKKDAETAAETAEGGDA